MVIEAGGGGLEAAALERDAMVFVAWDCAGKEMTVHRLYFLFLCCYDFKNCTVDSMVCYYAF